MQFMQKWIKIRGKDLLSAAHFRLSGTGQPRRTMAAAQHLGSNPSWKLQQFIQLVEIVGCREVETWGREGHWGRPDTQRYVHHSASQRQSEGIARTFRLVSANEGFAMMYLPHPSSIRAWRQS